MDFMLLSALAKENATKEIIKMNDVDFLDWLSLGDVDSINATLEHFISLDEVDAYMKCAIIRDYLKVIE